MAARPRRACTATISLPRLGALLALALLALAAGRALAEPRGEELAVLTYNVHGLPGWIAGDAPAARMPAIARRILPYAVVLLQEDFAHHEALRSGLREAVGDGRRARRVLRGGGAEGLCPICTGSGLSAVVGGGAVASAERLAAEPYRRCAGWLGGANDCLAHKGFLHLRVRLTNGARLDVVNTHLDAGDGAGDRAVRAAQLRRLAEAVERHAAGRALLVAGDLNLDAERREDRRLLAAFRTRLALRDAEARPARGRDWRRLDYLLWRSGDSVRLQRLEAGEDLRFVREGAPLSDHPALFARFRVRPRAAGAEPPVSGSSTSRRPRE